MVMAVTYMVVAATNKCLLSFSRMANTADNFNKISDERIGALAVVPPYESKTSGLAPGQWARGNIKEVGPGFARDFVVTGPKLRITYSGCRWNKLVFTMDGAPSTNAFVQFLNKIGAHVWKTIYASPDKYKPGAKSNARFSFSHDLIKPSSDPNMYPDEIRARLSSKRQANDEEPTEFMDIVDTIIFKKDEEFGSLVVEPYDIKAGGYMIPVIKISYYRNGDTFGLVMTVLKGMYFPPTDNEGIGRISNAEWNMDISDDL